MPLRDKITMESVPNEDRISQLPDPILHHILSKVVDFTHNNTIHLVRTCIILSKRWSNLWASFPHLCFNCCDLWASFHHLRLNYGDNPRDYNVQFARVIDAVLAFRDSSDLQSFCLKWTNDTNEDVACLPLTWMQYALNHNVKDLTVKVVLAEKYFQLPSGIFTCSSLEKLFLDIMSGEDEAIGYIEFPGFVQLRRLRELHLIFISNSISLKAIMSGCPVLEDLRLSECLLQDPDICSNSLKTLIINCCQITGKRLWISASRLQYLDLTENDLEGPEVLLENLSSLAEASLPTSNSGGHYINGNDMELLKYVYPYRKYMSGNKRSELRSFHNLKQLHLVGSSMTDGPIIIGDLLAVAHFLNRSPNLELITVDGEAVIVLDPILKKRQLMIDFGCPHLKDVLATFNEKSDKIAKLLKDFCDNRCSCFEEWESALRQANLRLN